MAGRGDYRPIHAVLLDDPDFQRLSPEARLLWFVLKLRLGISGIGVVYPETLPRHTGIPFDSLSIPQSELKSGKWLRSEGPLWWLRNGLKFEPTVSLQNQKQRKGVVSHLAGLPKLAIVNQFAAYYGLDAPFPDLPNSAGIDKNSPKAIDGLSKGYRSKEPEPDIKETPSSNRSANSTSAKANGREPDAARDELWPVYIAELGGEPPHPRPTAKRLRLLRLLHGEQLACDPPQGKSPAEFFREILLALKASEFHMSKRSYQLPESFLRNEERRDSWSEMGRRWRQAEDPTGEMVDLRLIS